MRCEIYLLLFTPIIEYNVIYIINNIIPSNSFTKKGEQNTIKNDKLDFLSFP